MKRLVDLFVSCLGILIGLPFILLIAVLVFLFLGRPVLFKQTRPGKRGQLFDLYKFRSMTNKRDSAGKLLANELRLTPFGKFLRASSLDELPALFNVLKGEMSLVGPRPLRVEYLQYYSQEQNRRHEVRPGITGWAQVNGRNKISWEEKFNLDVWYVDNHSFMLDLKILWLTVYKVLKRDGINTESETFVEPFKGAKIEE